MSLIKLLKFTVCGDERGSLIALQQGIEIPFQIKRVYYIYATSNNVSRGFHAHKNLNQVAVCVSGKCKIILDNGSERDELWLDSPENGILIDNMIWREMHDFSPNCVLLVMASDHYDESDYIRSYEEFKKINKHD